LKKAGIPEEIIVFMAENRYTDVDKVLRLKEAGFKDETILAVVRSESKDLPPAGESPAGGTPALTEDVTVETPGKIQILWYLVYRGEPVVQNKQAIEDARISLVGHNTVKLEWKGKDGLGLLEVFRKKAFESPFYWTLDEGDTLEAGKGGYAWMLKSTVNHRGKPPTDGAHYWIVQFTPNDPRLAERLRKILPEK
ncbi:MAG TPA: hypothetical protein VIU83_03455, partial [Candidatus Deferrimicrobium sp.]